MFWPGWAGITGPRWARTRWGSSPPGRWPGVVVVAVAAWGLLRCGPQARLFVPTALVTGFLLTMLPVTVHGFIAIPGEVHTIVFAHGSRHAQVPILLLYSSRSSRWTRS